MVILNKFDLNTIFIFVVVLGLFISCIGIFVDLYEITLIGIVILFISMFLLSIKNYDD